MLSNDKRIQTRKQLRDVLDFELPFYKCSSIAMMLQVSEKAILRRHQILLRKTEYYTNSNRKLRSYLYRYLLLRLQNRYAIHIPINCCEKGIHIMHIGPILINSNAQVGERCSFHINTALVANGLSDQAPILGKHVVMGIGSVALGGISIADNTAIGANAVVTKDILEKNTAVAGAPAKKISNNGTLQWNK